MMKSREWFVNMLEELNETRRMLREQQAKSEHYDREMRSLDRRVNAMKSNLVSTLLQDEIDVGPTADALMYIQQVAVTRDHWAAEHSKSVEKEEWLENRIMNMAHQTLAFSSDEVVDQDPDEICICSTDEDTDQDAE